MPANVVIGAQWGDEGKGAVVDRESDKADAVVRFNGGANAGRRRLRQGEEPHGRHRGVGQDRGPRNGQVLRGGQPADM